MSSSDRKVILGAQALQLDGVMQARIPTNDTMNVTVSVKVDNQMVPVIGIKLKRLDEGSVGAIASE
jgi:hypothetical protein